MRIRSLSLIVSAVLAMGVLMPAPSSAHKTLKKGVYECYLYTGYSNFDLRIKAGGKYVWSYSDGNEKKSGNFVHDGKKVRFTSGYLKKQGFKGKHLIDTGLYGKYHVINLFQDGEQVYNCSN